MLQGSLQQAASSWLDRAETPSGCPQTSLQHSLLQPVKYSCRSSSQAQLPVCAPCLKAKTCETRSGAATAPWRTTAYMCRTLLMLPPKLHCWQASLMRADWSLKAGVEESQLNG